MYDFEDISFALSSAANDEKVVEVTPTSLDIIDNLFDTKSWRDNTSAIEQLLKTVLHEVSEIVSVSGFHTTLMKHLGDNQAVSYNSSVGTEFSMCVHFRKSRVVMTCHKTQKGFVYKCVRRDAVLLTTAAASIRTSKDFFKPAPVSTDRHSFRGAGNVFLPPIALTKIKPFRTGKTPKMTAGILPVLGEKEVAYLKHVLNNYPNADNGISKQHFIQTAPNFHHYDFPEYMGVLYQWGLVDMQDNVLYFNVPIIQAIMDKLQSIDFIGVTPREGNNYFGLIDHLVRGKIVLMKSIPSTAVVKLKEQGLMLFEEKTPGVTKSMSICTATQKGTKVYNAWVDIYKMVEPYVAAMRNSLK